VPTAQPRIPHRKRWNAPAVTPLAHRPAVAWIWPWHDWGQRLEQPLGRLWGTGSARPASHSITLGSASTDRVLARAGALGPAAGSTPIRNQLKLAAPDRPRP